MRLPLLEPCPHVLPAEEFARQSNFLADLGQMDDPVAVMLTCSELGFVPDQVSHANPGEIMIVQNLGGVVLPSDTDETFVSIMYGLQLPTVRHLIVCGHIRCGILGTVFAEGAKGNTNPFGSDLQSVRARFHTTYHDRPARDWLGIFIQETILQQLAHLRSATYVQSRLQQGKLFLHGWIRDDETSSIIAYEPVLGQFCS